MDIQHPAEADPELILLLPSGEGETSRKYGLGGTGSRQVMYPSASRFNVRMPESRAAEPRTWTPPSGGEPSTTATGPNATAKRRPH